MLRIHSAFSSWRDYLTPTSNTSTFTTTGELTPEEFVAAGDYLVYKFPTWSWSGVADASKRVAYLPEDKQYLVLKHAPCHTRLDQGFVAWNPDEEGDEPEETAGLTGKMESLKVADEERKAPAPQEDEDSDDEIPDMDDEDDDEAIVRSDKDAKKRRGGAKAPLRYYNLYLTYSTYFRVPRSYLSGYDGSTNLPLHPPTAMFDDISTDYRDKTVTIEPFPFSETATPVQMASVHPCRHAETMKRIFDGMAKRKARRDAKDTEGKEREGDEGKKGEEGEDKEWEEVSAAADAEAEEEGGLRVDQYLVVFVKFLAGVVPGVEMDYTMGI